MAFCGKEAKDVVVHLLLYKVYFVKVCYCAYHGEEHRKSIDDRFGPWLLCCRRTRSSSTVDSLDAIEQPQSPAAKGKVPTYVKQIIQLLVETRKKIKGLGQRNADLLEELRLLRQETFLKEKVASFEIT